MVEGVTQLSPPRFPASIPLATRDAELNQLDIYWRAANCLGTSPGLKLNYACLSRAISRDEVGMTRTSRQFSFPGGIPSHASPETPGSIYEGVEIATPSLMPSGRLSTTQAWSSRASSAT